jgi:hypothetical protein
VDIYKVQVLFISQCVTVFMRVKEEEGRKERGWGKVRRRKIK